MVFVIFVFQIVTNYDVQTTSDYQDFSQTPLIHRLVKSQELMNSEDLGLDIRLGIKGNQIL